MPKAASDKFQGGPGAYEFYVTIQGSKQGKFKGESLQHKDKIPALSFSYEVKAPRDVATGQASGKRTHEPIVVTKEWGASSPQIFAALVGNEPLKSVLFEFVATRSTGVEEVYHTIKLTNASIATYKQYTHHVDAGHTYELEDVGFTFQMIEIENKDGSTAASDNWAAGRAPSRTQAPP